MPQTFWLLPGAPRGQAKEETFNIILSVIKFSIVMTLLFVQAKAYIGGHDFTTRYFV